MRLLPGLGQFSYWLHSLAQSGKFRTQLMQQLALLHHRNEELQQRLTEVAVAQEAANERVRQTDIYLDNCMADITRVARNVEHRLSEYAPSPAPYAAGAPLRSDTFMEGFYLAFENHFRGSRESIKSRQRPYLQYLNKMAVVKSSPLTVLDIGCGRGEWLELLSEQGYDIKGVDSDLEMVRYVRKKGFYVEYEDALTYLKGLPDKSLDVVTGFHIIEHLPLESLLQLIDEVLRTLHQTGIAIFETPNPENLQVGACNFYNDPTHLHPIPPLVAQFMARQRGFARTSILRLNPYPVDHQVAQEGELAKRFNELMFGPQDYALLAWKRHED